METFYCLLKVGQIIKKEKGKGWFLKKKGKGQKNAQEMKRKTLLVKVSLIFQSMVGTIDCFLK